MPGGCQDYDDDGDKIEESGVILTTSRWWWAATELDRFDLGTSDEDEYEGDDGNDVNADDGEESLQADNWLMQTWRTECIVLDCLKIGQYMSDL
jgi:hypothetical protein